MSEESKEKKYDGLRVKPEFVLAERSPVLAPIPKEAGQDPGSAGGGDARDQKRRDDRDNPSNKHKKRKRKGQNKKRPRDERQDMSEKMCLSVLTLKDCPYGDNCKFSHDTKTYMATRPPDIPLEGGCPNFKLHGYCIYGVMCRFGSSHITKTGENIMNEKAAKERFGPDGNIPLQGDSVNILPRDVQLQLRKNKYPFKCKRHNEKKETKEESDEKPNDVTRETGTDDPPSPPTEDATTRTISSPADKSSSGSPLELKARKKIDFSGKVYVAPLTTVGNLPFRRIMKKYGADITCGEMALATSLLGGQPSEWALLKRHADEDVFGVQIAAGHPDQYTRCCELLEKYTTVDFVDLNLGCPLDLVCNKGAGASLMLREKKLKGILSGISDTLSCPFTVKMRTGWDMAKPFAHQLVPKIQSWNVPGLATIMVHGRSRLQRYSKLANWDYISQVANSQSSELPTIPVVGNGDIFSYTDYEEKVAREGVSSCAMLARGALIKPWLPTEIKEKRHWDISATERLDMLKDFTRFGLEHWGSDQQGVDNTRRFLLEWQSFLHRYVPVGLLEVVPQQLNERPPPNLCGRSDLETLFMSDNCADWIKISEMLLGPVPDGFRFEPKHKANSYARPDGTSK